VVTDEYSDGWFPWGVIGSAGEVDFDQRELIQGVVPCVSPFIQGRLLHNSGAGAERSLYTLIFSFAYDLNEALVCEPPPVPMEVHLVAPA